MNTTTITLLGTAALVAGAFRAQAQAPLTVRVADAFGTVEKKLPGASTYQKLSVGEKLSAGTTIRTGDNAAALVELPDKHVVRVGAKTTVILNQIGQDKQYALKLVTGQVWALVKKANQPSKFTVETASGVAGVTGTFFGVGVDETDGETVVSTGEGSVNVQSYDDKGQAFGAPVPVTQGQMARVARRRTLQAALAQNREHAQMWKLLYAEGAWAQQVGNGQLRMKRNSEQVLWRYLRARAMQNQGQQHPAVHRGQAPKNAPLHPGKPGKLVRPGRPSFGSKGVTPPDLR